MPDFQKWIRDVKILRNILFVLPLCGLPSVSHRTLIAIRIFPRWLDSQRKSVQLLSLSSRMVAALFLHSRSPFIQAFSTDQTPTSLGS